MLLPMTVPELNIAPRGRGRAAAPVFAEVVRELVPSDLALLASERQIKPPSIVRIRDRHHALARVLAQGATDADASRITGYDPSRISILKGDPTFRALIEDYKSVEDGMLADFTERTMVLSLTAVNNLQELLENDEAPLPASMQLEIAKFAADRTGHAPVQKSVNMNVNADLGSRLAAARARLAKGVQITSVTTVESGDSVASTGTDG